MAKYCTRCGQLSDDTAAVCAACGAPFQNRYPMDDEPVTVVADDVYEAPRQESAYQPDPAPTYQQPANTYQPDPAPAYQQPANPYQPDPAPTYQQPANTYQPDPAPAYQQPANTYQPDPAPAYQQPANTYQPDSAPAYQQPANPYPSNPSYQQSTAPTPLNMSAPRYAVPLQQQNGYQSVPEKKNKGMVLGIVIISAIVLVIAAVIVTIILVSNSGSHSGGSGGTAASLQGSYYLNSQNDHGTQISRELLQQYLGGDITMTIGSDNTGTISAADGSAAPVTFNTADRTVTVSGAGSGTYTLSGNTLTLTLENGAVIDEFIRQ